MFATLRSLLLFFPPGKNHHSPTGTHRCWSRTCEHFRWTASAWSETRRSTIATGSCAASSYKGSTSNRVGPTGVRSAAMHRSSSWLTVSTTWRWPVSTLKRCAWVVINENWRVLGMIQRTNRWNYRRTVRVNSWMIHPVALIRDFISNVGSNDDSFCFEMKRNFKYHPWYPALNWEVLW